MQASAKAGTNIAFYKLVDMRNPSRSYFVRSGGILHSLKAITTFALRELRPNVQARDFHAADAAAKLRELRLDVVHQVESSGQRRRQTVERLARSTQSTFRSQLLDLYRHCPLTGCTTPEALEACHVKGVGDEGGDKRENGVLLRADLHRLFDKHLLAICPTDGLVHLAPGCKNDYAELLGDVSFMPPPGGPTLDDFLPRWAIFTAILKA